MQCYTKQNQYNLGGLMMKDLPLKQSVNIFTADIVCDDFLGLSAVYHGFVYMPEQINRGMSDYDRMCEFEYVKSSNIKIARTMFLPSYNCADIYGPYDMQNRRMQAFVKWCRDMQALGIEIAFQAGWHYSRHTYHGHDAPDSENDPNAFASWVCATLDYLYNECRIDNIKYLFLFTEPTGYSSGITPDGYTIWSYYVKICKTLNDKLISENLRDKLKLVGPNNSHGGVHLAEAVRDLDDVIDIYTGHDYNFVHFNSWNGLNWKMRDIVKSTGKPFWLDEYGMQLEIFRQTPEYGTYLASIIATSIAQGHQTSMIWILLDQLYTSWQYDGEADFNNYNTDSFHNGIHRWGLVTWPHDTVENAGSPYPAWYAFKLISNAFAGRCNHGKARAFRCENSMYVVTAAIEDDSGYTIIAVNYSSEIQPVDIVMDKSETSVLYRRTFEIKALTEQNTSATPLKINLTNGIINDILPAGGFAIYTTRENL